MHVCCAPTESAVSSRPDWQVRQTPRGDKQKGRGWGVGESICFASVVGSPFLAMFSQPIFTFPPSYPSEASSSAAATAAAAAASYSSASSSSSSSSFSSFSSSSCCSCSSFSSSSSSSLLMLVGWSSSAVCFLQYSLFSSSVRGVRATQLWQLNKLGVFRLAVSVVLSLNIAAQLIKRNFEISERAIYRYIDADE